MKKYLILCFLVIYGTSIFAQSNIKVMSYNLLIYPEGEMVNRIDTLSLVIIVRELMSLKSQTLPTVGDSNKTWFIMKLFLN